MSYRTLLHKVAVFQLQPGRGRLIFEGVDLGVDLGSVESVELTPKS